MKKDIKDYLHLYLGCDVELDNGGSKVYNRVLCAVGGVGDGPYQYCKLRTTGGLVHAVLLKEGKVKLSLRPLPDMKRDEAINLGWTDGMNYNNWLKSMILFDLWKPEQFGYLLKQGFDLFGLIVSELAIDKTKLIISK